MMVNWRLLLPGRLRVLFLGCTLVACAGLGSSEVGVSDTVVTLGQSAPFSGRYAPLARRYHEGAALYFDAANADGGVAGRMIKVVALDDGSDTQRALANTHRLLYEDRVFALVNYVGTRIVNAHLPIIAAEKVPFFAPYAEADFLRSDYHRYLINLRASATDEAQFANKPEFDDDSIAVARVSPSPAAATPLVREYQRLLKARNPAASPDYIQFEGFVSARVFVEALRRTGRDLTREKLIATLEKMDRADFGGFTVGFSSDRHNGTRFVELAMMDGTVQPPR